jgi:hypothetical protein
MESFRFKYVSLAHAEAGGGSVGINFLGQEGHPCTAILSLEDAKRLSDDLPNQLHIACWKPDRGSIPRRAPERRPP